MDPKSQTTEDLVRSAIGGDMEALTELLSRHGPRVEEALRIGKLWQNSIDPGDVMQVSYLEAFLQIGQFRPEKAASFEAWLRRIAENNLRDAIRGLERQKQPPPSQRIRTQGPTGDSFSGLFDLLVAHSSTPSRTLRREEVRDLIQAAVARLPDDYSRVVRMYDLEGQPIEEVATALQRSPGAIHMLRARAHDRLGELLETAATWFASSA
ncbi:MAG TPA: sigma-70 family RNA polymerase sigma factor [Phycisphaerae bacterium]|nr:sigma-70 family RNA polymerase sigma factor [Phycisphaerae bacterium]